MRCAVAAQVSASRSEQTTAAPSSASSSAVAAPIPDPAPVTTIAWRLAHLQIGIFGQRAASHFGGPAISYDTYYYPGDAATALSRLDTAYAAWAAGVRTLDPEGLGRPIGQAEGPFAAEPMAALILHINREALHHGAEISLLRDLYLWRD